MAWASGRAANESCRGGTCETPVARDPTEEMTWHLAPAAAAAQPRLGWNAPRSVAEWMPLESRVNDSTYRTRPPEQCASCDAPLGPAPTRSVRFFNAAGRQVILFEVLKGMSWTRRVVGDPCCSPACDEAWWRSLAAAPPAR